MRDGRRGWRGQRPIILCIRRVRAVKNNRGYREKNLVQKKSAVDAERVFERKKTILRHRAVHAHMNFIVMADEVALLARTV